MQTTLNIIMYLVMCGFLSSSTCYKNILSYEEHDVQRERITRKFCLKIYYLQDAKIL